VKRLRTFRCGGDFCTNSVETIAFLAKEGLLIYAAT